MAANPASEPPNSRKAAITVPATNIARKKTNHGVTTGAS